MLRLQHPFADGVGVGVREAEGEDELLDAVLQRGGGEGVEAADEGVEFASSGICENSVPHEAMRWCESALTAFWDDAILSICIAALY